MVTRAAGRATVGKGCRGMTQQLNTFRTDRSMEAHLETFRRTLDAYPVGACPLSMELTMLQNASTQSCGKCVPCRDGLPQLAGMLRGLLDGAGDAASRAEELAEMTALAELVRDTSDCAIGYQPATVLLEGMRRFDAEYRRHVDDGRCREDRGAKVPCISLCPAHVDVPGYIALLAVGDAAGAVRLIRENNPLPSACALICESPCESHCRRQLIDDAVNIRGLKEYAVDQAPADSLPVPERGPDTGRTIAVVGGGPSGLTAAWFLSLMGHRVVIIEGHHRLGGMLRYGIPNYRFPKDRLDSDIAGILAVGGIEVRTGVVFGVDVTLADLHRDYDAVYLATGAQSGQGLTIPGESAEGVYSAVDMLRGFADGDVPDYSGKRVIVVGGGNVAMDAARSALRCNAADVRIVYRRRRDDMTALHHEIVGAVREDIHLTALRAPVRVETDDAGRAVALWVQPQMAGVYDAAGRPRPTPLDVPPERIPADVILIAVGQAIDSDFFVDADLPVARGRLVADDTGLVAEHTYGGGDCVTGPATVIQAIAAGKVAAYRIDEDLGYHHAVSAGIAVPEPGRNNRVPTGRVEAPLRDAMERKHDFAYVGLPMTRQEAEQEMTRCLRCDHYGSGALVEGR